MQPIQSRTISIVDIPWYSIFTITCELLPGCSKLGNLHSSHFLSRKIVSTVSPSSPAAPPALWHLTASKKDHHIWPLSKGNYDIWQLLLHGTMTSATACHLDDSPWQPRAEYDTWEGFPNNWHLKNKVLQIDVTQAKLLNTASYDYNVAITR